MRTLGIQRNGRQPIIHARISKTDGVPACAYYVLRPVRDAMGIVGGVRNLQWLFTGTFLAMLAAVPIYGAICSRFRKSQFLPWVYLFFIANILIFYLAFQAMPDQVWAARAFFVWVSVFNLFIVSVFWSFMADIYSKEQGKRLFGLIAAGGSAGGLTGPLLTALLTERAGVANGLGALCAGGGTAKYAAHDRRRSGGRYA